MTRASEATGVGGALQDAPIQQDPGKPSVSERARAMAIQRVVTWGLRREGPVRMPRPRLWAAATVLMIRAMEVW